MPYSDSIDCPHFGSCPGCLVAKGLEEATPILAMARQYFNSFGVDYNVVRPTSVQHWRTQAKLVAHHSKWSPNMELGLYQRQSHTVVSIPDCTVHHPSINQAVELLCQYSLPSLRYVQLSVERSTGRVCLTLIVHAETLKDAQPSLGRLLKQLTHDVWHSVWVHCNPHDGNAIFCRDGGWHRVRGPEFVRETILDTTFHFTPHTFRQGNLDGFAAIAQAVTDRIPQGSRVCELYAGVGVLGLAAYTVKSLEWLRCSDENPYNERCFVRSVALLDDDDNNKPTYLVASAAKALDQGQAMDAQVLVVDPPRKGLDEDVLDALCLPSHPLVASVETLIYVSCGLDALMRETERLVGQWKLESVTGYLLFPGSNHVETLAIFTRK